MTKVRALCLRCGLIFWSFDKKKNRICKKCKHNIRVTTQNMEKYGVDEQPSPYEAMRQGHR